MNPYLNAKFSTVDYCFPDRDNQIQACMFIPRYDLIKDPTQQQRIYVNQVIREVGEAFPQDYIYRQRSAHEMWTNLAAKNQDVSLQASVADVYTAIVENQS